MSFFDKPWKENYRLGPYRLETSLDPYPEIPLYSILDQSAAKYPSQTAILFQGTTIKYHQLKTMTDSFAAGLQSLGLNKGDRVCLCLPNSIEFILAYWAILKAGGVVVPSNILRTEEGLIHEVDSSGSRVIMAHENNLELILSVARTCQIEHLIVVRKNNLDELGQRTSLPKGVHELPDLMSEPTFLPVDIYPKHDLCELAFTGGATGIPKGVMLSHYNRSTVICQGLPWLMKPMLQAIAGKASVLLALPLFHAYGGFVHQTAIHLGLRIILISDPRNTHDMLDNIMQHRPFLVPGVPTQFIRLAEAGLKRSNTMLFSGSAPLPDEISRTIKAKTGMPVTEAYGLTETSALTHVNLSVFSKITGFLTQEIEGIGVPTPDTECKLIDIQTGNAVSIGEPGEIVSRGPQIMMGYWPKPGTGLASDGWLHTGDIGIMDNKGYFRVVDRIKDMINVSGLKVYTTEVDEVLFRHPAVQTAAVFGVPDLERPGSERVAAVIQLKEGYEDSISDDVIIKYCRENLPPYAVPKIIEFRKEIPLTVSEKVFKKALRDEIIASMGIKLSA